MKARSHDVSNSASALAALRDRYEEEGRTTQRYDSASFWDSRYHRRRFDFITERLRPLLVCAQSFLDVGCGSGEYVAFGRVNGVPSVYGTDISLAYCHRTAELARALTIVQSSADSLPFASGSVSVVLCSEVVEHLPPRLCGLAIEELCRVATDHVVITTPNGDAAIRRIARRLSPARVRRLDEAVGHINVQGLADWARLLGSVGGWRVSLLESVHVLPPIIGERVHLPDKLAHMVAWIESWLNRTFPKTGNCLIAVLEPVSCAAPS
jgi:SAM-dependent methyltransferase